MKKWMMIALSIGLAMGIAGCSASRDFYQQAMISDLDEEKMAVFATPEKVQIILLSDHIFVPNDNYVGEDRLPTVRKLARLLNEFEGTPIIITGHTDNIGTFQQRYDRSYAQAKNLTNELILLGVNPDRIKMSAVGDKQPIAKNNTVMGSSDNRRVEVVVYR